MTTFHTIRLEPWGSLGLGERVALEAATALLWPLNADDRMTVLINLLAAQIENMAAGDDQIDALIDLLRMQLKLGLHHDQTEDQHRVDHHDYDQLLLLARLNKIRLTELVRRIVQAHLDKGKANLRKERVE